MQFHVRQQQLLDIDDDPLLRRAASSLMPLIIKRHQTQQVHDLLTNQT